MCDLQPDPNICGDAVKNGDEADLVVDNRLQAGGFQAREERWPPDAQHPEGRNAHCIKVGYVGILHQRFVCQAIPGPALELKTFRTCRTGSVWVQAL